MAKVSRKRKNKRWKVKLEIERGRAVADHEVIDWVVRRFKPTRVN